jgi:hypothetical protein
LLVDTNELNPDERTPTLASKSAGRHLHLVEASEPDDETGRPPSADAMHVDPWSRKTPAA